MNKLFAIVSVMTLMMISCGEKEKIVEVAGPPSPPRGVYAVNLDGKVEICWIPNYYESNIASYAVYRGTSLTGDFAFIGEVPAQSGEQPAQYCFDDLDTENGVHYWYGVAAVNGRGRSSDLIIEEIVSGTPRPEGLLTLQDALVQPLTSGFDFYPGLISTAQPYDAPTTDIYFGHAGGTPMIIARRVGVEIQDYGYAGNFDAIGLAPENGWAPSRTAEAIVDHMYFLQLVEADGVHYAKLFVTAVTASSVTFYWAFQTDPGNPDLSPPAPRSGGTSVSSSYRANELSGLNAEAKLTDRFSDPPIVEKRVARTRDSGFGQQTTE